MILSLSLFQIERDEKFEQKVCGQKNRTELSAKPSIVAGNKLTLIFHTSDFNPESHQHTGFLASYKKVGTSLKPDAIKIHPKHLNSVALAACYQT